MKNLNKIKLEKKQRRQVRTRSKIHGTAERPRLSVFRSNKSISLQLIDDDKRVTIVSAKESEVKDVEKIKGKIAKAFETGKILAEKAVAAKIKKVIFDKGSYKYHGRVKATADGAREGGLEF